MKDKGKPSPVLALLREVFSSSRGSPSRLSRDAKRGTPSAAPSSRLKELKAVYELGDTSHQDEDAAEDADDEWLDSSWTWPRSFRSAGLSYSGSEENLDPQRPALTRHESVPCNWAPVTRSGKKQERDAVRPALQVAENRQAAAVGQNAPTSSCSGQTAGQREASDGPASDWTGLSIPGFDEVRPSQGQAKALPAKGAPSAQAALPPLHPNAKASQPLQKGASSNQTRHSRKAKSGPLPMRPRSALEAPPSSRDDSFYAARENSFDSRSQDGGGSALTDADFLELQGCIDLGFGPRLDADDEGQGVASTATAEKLFHTLPALQLCYAVARQLQVSQSTPPVTPVGTAVLRAASDHCAGPPLEPWMIHSPGEHPEQMKTRLRHWAQAVACTVRLAS